MTSDDLDKLEYIGRLWRQIVNENWNWNEYWKIYQSSEHSLSIMFLLFIMFVLFFGNSI